MFRYSVFNNDISKWNVSNVKNNIYMFTGSNIVIKHNNQPKFE